MRLFILLFLFAVFALVTSEEKCRDDEYNPGPNCGLEPTCAARSSHAYPKHSCDCWCKPGTYRVIETNECVTLTNCH